ncbi:MAG: DNA-3-methyladenine glycosylase I [Ignavibacteria bacterium]|nr:DNA-3-methyladenine glycosylase I [Ignavibacteria bacterium]
MTSVEKNNIVQRCGWCGEDPLYVAYHDTEWGVPVHDEQKLFEFILLESMQAGLSWITILKKRENFRAAFAQFVPEKIAQFNDSDIERCMNDSGIIRNRLKVNSAVKNARAFLELQARHGSFNTYIWQFTDGRVIQNKWNSMKEIPAVTPQSEAMSKDLKKNGFTFVGPTVCYAHMQATGMMNDHLVSCFRHLEVLR